jgi:hypothetical protein
LDCHPDIYVPRRKELYFFNRYYDRGLQWYEDFFPSAEEANRYRAIGEVSPQYWYWSLCPRRIADIPSITKLIMLVRNPVDRAYSHYGLRVKNGVYSGSFEDFWSVQPLSIEWGFYTPKLKHYLRYFEKDQILVLIYEQIMVDIAGTKEILASFLDVSPDRFLLHSGTKQINRSYVPKARSAYALAAKIAWRLRYRWGLDGVVNFAKRCGVEHVFGERGSLPPLKRETRHYLQNVFEGEIRELESLLQIDLACWRE